MDGDILVVGALGNDALCPDDPTFCNSGASIYERNAGGLESVAISGDNIAVGAPLLDTGAGSVFMHGRRPYPADTDDRAMGSQTAPCSPLLPNRRSDA